MNSFFELFYTSNEVSHVSHMLSCLVSLFQIFFKACENGNTERVKSLLSIKKDSDLDIDWECRSSVSDRFTDESGLAHIEKKNQTPLMVSSFRGHLPVVQLLIQEGAKVNKQDKVRNRMWLKVCSA